VVFHIYDDSNPPLLDSPSPFISYGWQFLLEQYPGDLPVTIAKILQFGTLVGYEGPDSLIISKNQESVYLAPEIIDVKLRDDLAVGRIVPASQTSLFISSPLGLVPKHDGGFRRIHNLSHPGKKSVNANICDDYSSLEYSTIEDVLQLVRIAGQHCSILKRDIKDAFRNIPIAPHIQWLLGFEWKGIFYKETCLPFGLSTAPFIFNLFAEAFHWILQSWLQWNLLQHYLDDFITVIPASARHKIPDIETNYISITNMLGIPRNDTKNQLGTVITVLGLEVDTDHFTLRVPEEKMRRAFLAASRSLQQDSITRKEMEALAGFLGFCAPAVQLGRLHMRTIWTFVASYPQHKSPFIKKRLTADVREDLVWWKDLLPAWNGVHFFNDSVRDTISLFTDSSGFGIGGFHVANPVDPNLIDYASIRVENSFFEHLPPSDPHLSEGHFDINIHEMEAILFAFQQWGHLWVKKKVFVYTDNASCQAGLRRQTLRGAAFWPLRQTLLHSAQLDIFIEPIWIPGHTNVLADALSRFNFDQVVNLCPHWQPYFPTLLRPSLPGQSQFRT
jgi:hypothetical protein